ncbi:MAG TPA: methyltransferase [Gammaproteobacteria bacterium]
MNLAQRFRRLDTFLADHAWLWRPQPFKQARPDWCARLPGLCGRLLGLSDDELARLTENSTALNALLAEHLPAMAGMDELCRIPEHHTTTLADLGPHFANGIPGRKWRQVRAFAAALGPVRAPLLEWCGGKGHLGRLLAAQWRQPVLTLDHDAALCEEGAKLAQRARVEQGFRLDDALGASAADAVAARHAVALHACGELHRTLVREAVAQRAPALDIAPCCFHLLLENDYQPFTATARLRLGRDDLRLAVTETVTAVGREVRLRDREMAWKLGFNLLRGAGDDGEYRPIRPIDKGWLKGDFAGFCRALAAREGVSLSPDVAWHEAEQAGWRRQRETMRLSLVRNAFRRAIELWLVLDLSCLLEANGYAVRIGTFCAREVTPRNILISARLD